MINWLLNIRWAWRVGGTRWLFFWWWFWTIWEGGIPLIELGMEG